MLSCEGNVCLSIRNQTRKQSQPYSLNFLFSFFHHFIHKFIFWFLSFFHPKFLFKRTWICRHLVFFFSFLSVHYFSHSFHRCLVLPSVFFCFVLAVPHLLCLSLKLTKKVWMINKWQVEPIKKLKNGKNKKRKYTRAFCFVFELMKENEELLSTTTTIKQKE